MLKSPRSIDRLFRNLQSNKTEISLAAWNELHLRKHAQFFIKHPERFYMLLGDSDLKLVEAAAIVVAHHFSSVAAVDLLNSAKSEIERPKASFIIREVLANRLR